MLILLTEGRAKHESNSFSEGRIYSYFLVRLLKLAYIQWDAGFCTIEKYHRNTDK